jgi:FtsZ-interacting cell division protein ZipA
MAQYIIPGIVSIIIVIVEALAAKERRSTKDDRELRRQESRLSMDMMLTTSEMCDVLCNALQGGKTNGNVEQARSEAKRARDAYEAFLREQAARQVSKA